MGGFAPRLYIQSCDNFRITYLGGKDDLPILADGHKPKSICLLRVLSQLLAGGLDPVILTGAAERGEQGSRRASYHNQRSASARSRLSTGMKSPIARLVRS